MQIANCNKLTDSFASPSIILKLGHLIKQCCEISEFIILKEQDGQTEKIKQVQNMKYFMEKEWSHEISTNTLKDIT